MNTIKSNKLYQSAKEFVSNGWRAGSTRMADIADRAKVGFKETEFYLWQKGKNIGNAGINAGKRAAGRASSMAHTAFYDDEAQRWSKGRIAAGAAVTASSLGGLYGAYHALDDDE